MLTVQCYIYSQNASLGVNGGYTTNGYGAQIGYYRELVSNSELHVTFNASFSKDKKESVSVPYKNISLNVGYFYKLYQDRYNRFTFSVGGGGLVGYETVNNGDKELSNGSLITAENNIVYGAFGGLDVSYYLTDTLALMAVANQFYHMNSDIGNSYFYGGIGVKKTLF